MPQKRKILRIETDDLTNLNKKQIGFETNPDFDGGEDIDGNATFKNLQLFPNQAFWGGKDNQEDGTVCGMPLYKDNIYRFICYDSIARVDRIQTNTSRIIITNMDVTDGTYTMDEPTLSGTSSQSSRSWNTINIGYGAGMGNLFGSQPTNTKQNSIFIGRDAGNTLNDFPDSICIGTSAGRVSSTCHDDICIGEHSFYETQSCSATISIGKDSGIRTHFSRDSIFIGNRAGSPVPIESTGSITASSKRSIIIGMDAGRASPGCSDAIFIGTSAGYESPGCSDSIFIGKAVGVEESETSDTLLIGNGDNIVIRSKMGQKRVTINKVLNLPDTEVSAVTSATDGDIIYDGGVIKYHHDGDWKTLATTT